MIFQHPEVICAFSQKRGNMSLVYGPAEGVIENRKDFLFNYGIDHRRLVCAKQVHGSNVRHIQENDKGKGALSYDSSIGGTDAFITNERNLPLAVFTADCLSVFLYDPVNSAIGLVHAGWRGSKDGILRKTIKAMGRGFKTSPRELLAGFGPAIRDCCYEVKDEFKGFFSQGLFARNGSLYLDLAGVNKNQLLEAGVKEANISDSKICTSCRNKEFFSYRRQGASCGRMLSVIMLK